MNYEHIKTGLLIALVGLSILLTWKLWTFQPDINFLGESGESERAPLLNDEILLSDAIKPEQMVVYLDGESMMIPRNAEAFATFYEELLQSTITEGDMLATGPFPKQNVRAGIEVIFPTFIPTDLFLAMFNVDREEFNVPTSEVDRLFVYLNEVEDTISMQMLSTKEDRVIEVETSLDVSTFEEFARGDYIPVRPIHRSRPTTQLYEHIYVPTEPVEMKRVTYTTSPINVNFFIDELFNDPNSVRAHIADTDESFTDGNRIIQLRNDGEFMDYNNPLFSENQERSNRHIVQSSFDFINSHGGWSDPYYLTNWESADVREEAEFLLHVEETPVISYAGQNLMRLKVDRVGTQIISYERPLFDLDTHPINAIQSVELPSGEAVLDRLGEQEFFQTSQVEKMIIGYEMNKQDVSLISLDPYWYVLYDGRWQKVTFDEEVVEEEMS